MGWTFLGLNPGRDRNFFVLQNVQPVCGAQKPSYSVDADTPFLRGKVARL